MIKVNSLLLLFLCSQLLNAQQMLPAGGGAVELSNTENCLSEDNRAKIQTELKENQLKLEKSGAFAAQNYKSAIVSFDWPMRKSTSNTFNDYYGISNFVDHNPLATGDQFGSSNEDYNCGTRSYDLASGYNHRGIDYFLYPFPWYQYENNFVEVIAAAEGVIIGKDDGNSDNHCACNGNWNGIYIRHADGSQAWYGHFKRNSLTTKAVGQMVSKGEYLGIVASSGCSTTAHLHFEVYDNNNNLIDPYAGPCNDLNTASWWTNQQPYRTPTLNALLTHDARPLFGCPSEEVPNLANEFVPGQQIYFGSYYHDQMEGSVSVSRVIRPDNTVWQSWNHTATRTYNASWWYWYFNLPTNAQLGTWIFEIDFQGQSHRHQFELVDPACIGGNNNCDKLQLAANVYLQGAYSNSTDILMRDDLRKSGLIPTTEPYSSLAGFNHMGEGGGEQVQSGVFNTQGVNAIVDWVFVELKNPSNNMTMATRSALIQRDGDVVDVDGFSPVSFSLPSGNYKVCIGHRNHLAATIQTGLNFTKGIITYCNFNSLQIYGVNALIEMPGPKRALWGGATNGTGSIVLTGPNNNANTLFFDIINAPNNVQVRNDFIYENVYLQTDFDMNGKAIYQGFEADANLLFFNVIQHPQNLLFSTSYIIEEQRP